MNYIEQNRDFKGVWIPKEIWLNDELTMLEKVILIEIDSLDNENHCIAGNDYLAQFCQCSESKITLAIKKLQKLGYIEVISFDGRHRKIRSCLVKSTMLPKEKYDADPEKVRAININNNIDTNIDNNNISNSKELEVDTSSKSLEKSSEKKKGRKSLKDQLIEYVNSLDYQQDTKDILFKWIFNVGIKKGLTVSQLQDKLKTLWEQCGDKEYLVRDTINKSYLGGYFAFYAPDTKKTFTEKPKIDKPAKEVKKEIETINFSTLLTY